MEASTALEVAGGYPFSREPADIPKGVRVAVRLTHYRSPASLFLRCELYGMSDGEGKEDFHISPSNNHVDDAFIGMGCLVCHDSSTKLALRAVVTDVHRNPSGRPLKVGVLYVDSGRTGVVELDCMYTVDAEAAAKPQKAIACCIRRVKPTKASSRFDLQRLWKRDTLFEAVFHTASDAGVYEVDLHAQCLEQKAGPKTYDVGRYLVENGFAKLVDYPADTPETVANSAQGVISVHHESGEGAHNCTLEQPSSVLPTDPEPTGDRFLHRAESCAVPKENSMEVLVTFISSPDHFYGQNVDRVAERSLVQTLILQSTKQLFLETEVKAGASYIYRELPEQCGARVHVEDVQGSGMCRVFLMDYGNRETVHFSCLFAAHPRLSCIAPLAIRFQLADIQPKTNWTEAAVNRFVQLAHTINPLTAVLVGKKSTHDDFDGQVHMVKLFSPTHGNVAECMSREGHAQASRRRRSALRPVPNLAGPFDPVVDEHNDPSCSPSINTEDPSLTASNVGARRDRRICKFYATQIFYRDGDRRTYRHVLRGPAQLSEPVIDPVKPLRPPEVGSCVLGQVSAIHSPSCFYLVFPYGRRSIERLSTDGTGRNSQEALETLTRDLQNAANEGSVRENRRVVKAQGELVAAKSNLDGRWYRARVVSLEEEDTLNVFYMDFGFCESVPVNRVKTLEERFTHLPQQALQACLVTDKAENRLGNKPTWDDHSCEAFASLVSGKDLVVKIVCVAQGLLHVRLYFIKNGEQLCSVRRCLKKALKGKPN